MIMNTTFHGIAEGTMSIALGVHFINNDKVQFIK
jgi:hypothetical protein